MEHNRKKSLKGTCFKGILALTNLSKWTLHTEARWNFPLVFLLQGFLSLQFEGSTEKSSTVNQERPALNQSGGSLANNVLNSITENTRENVLWGKMSYFIVRVTFIAFAGHVTQ